MPSFELGFATAFIVAILALGVAAAAAVLLYRRTLPPVSPVTRVTLIILRTASFGLLLLLLLEPVVRLTFQSERPPALAVVVDNSTSMRLRETTGDRRIILHEALHRLPEYLPGGSTLVSYVFGPVVLPPVTELPDSLPLDQQATNIALALQRVRSDADRFNTKAVLLLTDGNYTAGPNPQYAAEGLGIPLYVLGIGDSTEQRDVLVSSISANRVMLAGSPTPVDIRIKSTGAVRERVIVTLMEGNREHARSTLVLQEGTRESNVSLSFTPNGDGIRLYSAHVSAIAGELTSENNSRSFSARVLKGKLSVVLLAGAPGPDMMMMMQTIREDSHLLVRSFSQRPDGDFYEGAFSGRFLDSADCVVLLGYPSASTNDETLRVLAGAFQRRTIPLLVVTARTLDLGRVRLLAEVLPFTITSVNPAEQLVFVDPLETQRRHPLLMLDSTGEYSPWKNLPPVFRSSTVYSPKPGSTVLAVARLQTVRLNDPIIIARSEGGTRSLAIFAYGLWRWRLMAQGTAETSGMYAAFLSTAVRWLATRDDTRPVRITPVQPLLTPLDQVEFEGQVLDGAARPVDRAMVSVTIQGGDFSGAFTLAPAGSGRYSGSVSPLPGGRYIYHGSAMVGGSLVGADSGQFVVGALDIEGLETRMAASFLRELAGRTGGRLILPDRLAEVGAILRNQPSFVATEIRTANTIEFRHWPYALALLVVLLAAEWLIRKRSGML